MQRHPRRCDGRGARWSRRLSTNSATLPGLTLPRLSTADPEVAGEGLLDPLGLFPIADRLAELLVPHVRARMRRVRFLTAIAVGSVVNEPLVDEVPQDGISSAAICFEWIVLESFVRRLRDDDWTTGIPGSSKAQNVVALGQRLRASNYLKGPTVFGFHGVYQVLAWSLGIADRDLLPAEQTGALVQAWESDRSLRGFFDGTPGADGHSLRHRLTDAVRSSIRSGRCSVPESAWLWSQLADGLAPGRAGPSEKAVLRGWLIDGQFASRAELALALDGLPDQVTGERFELQAVRPKASAALRALIAAAVAYEEIAGRLDASFRSLCHISTLLGTHPLRPGDVTDHELLARCALSTFDSSTAAPMTQRPGS